MRPMSQYERALGAALGREILRQRRRVGLSRQDLAKTCEVSQHALMKIEQGHVASPGVFAVARVAHALDTSTDDLIDRARTRATRPPLHLGSLGYEGRTVKDLIDEAHKQRVQTIVDVRLTPISRKPGMSKTKLGQALNEAGIAYLHLRALGNPKENRPLFAGDDLEKGRERFRACIRNQQAEEALTRLADLAREQRVALLCFEADERRCHRSVIAEELAQLG